MNCGAACFPGGQAPFSTTKDTKVHKVNNSDGTQSALLRGSAPTSLIPLKLKPELLESHLVEAHAAKESSSSSSLS